MKKRLLIAAMVSFLFLQGCGSEEQTGNTPEKEKTPIASQIAQKSQKALETVSETAEKVQKETVEKTSKMTETVTQKTVELKKTAVDMTASVQERAGDVVEKAKETAVSLKEKTQNSLASLAPEPQHLVEPVAKNIPMEKAPLIPATGASFIEKSTSMEAITPSTDNVQQAAALAAAPETVVLENKKGKIIMPHKMHAENYSCTTCHGDIKPGPLTLEKDAAHALCKGCHKETGSGPTTCYSCHAKKPRKPIEGC